VIRLTRRLASPASPGLNTASLREGPNEPLLGGDKTDRPLAVLHNDYPVER
jgi:hypothetical protein